MMRSRAVRVLSGTAPSTTDAADSDASSEVLSENWMDGREGAASRADRATAPSRPGVT